MEFEASLEQLPSMIEHIHACASSKGVTGELLYRIELASEEALINIISYAYPEKSSVGKIWIHCEEKNEQLFALTIRDRGVPFDPVEINREINPDQPIEERQIGGLGIYLIRKVSNTFSYERQGDENCLEITFSLPQRVLD